MTWLLWVPVVWVAVAAVLRVLVAAQARPRGRGTGVRVNYSRREKPKAPRLQGFRMNLGDGGNRTRALDPPWRNAENRAVCRGIA